MSRSKKESWVRDHNSVATRLYNRKVRAHNNQNLRNAIANGLIDEDADLPFNTKSVFNDYNYCDYRFRSEHSKDKRK